MLSDTEVGLQKFMDCMNEKWKYNMKTSLKGPW